jgi:hypothetical protein
MKGGNMSEVKAVPEARFTRVALGVTLAVGLLATVAAALPVGPATESAPAPRIAPADAVGINVLEPAGVAPRPSAPADPSGSLERQLQIWTPTGNGGHGAHGSPKG